MGGCYNAYVLIISLRSIVYQNLFILFQLVCRFNILPKNFKARRMGLIVFTFVIPLINHVSALLCS